jgi:hypothetical protein
MIKFSKKMSNYSNFRWRNDRNEREGEGRAKERRDRRGADEGFGRGAKGVEIGAENRRRWIRRFPEKGRIEAAKRRRGEEGAEERQRRGRGGAEEG